MKYTAEQYATLLLDLIIGKQTTEIPEIVAKFVALLRKHHAIGLDKKILNTFNRLYNRKLNIHDVTVTSARELSNEEKVALRTSLVKTEEIRYIVRPELIGGVSIVIDNSVRIDGTIKNRVDRLFRY